jgi:hypothetical protein
MTRTQIADSHLTYIGSVYRPGEVRSVVAYDVYPRDGGHQLGWVYRTHGVWHAVSDDPTVDNATGRTRWEAATALWGTA